MKPMLKSMLSAAAVLVAVVVMAVGGMVFWIKSDHGRTWLQSLINTAIPGTVTIEKFGLALLKPRLDFYGVVLQPPHGAPVAGLTHLSVELDWRALWRREIRLKHILLQAPWVDLKTDPVLGNNLLAALVPPTASSIGDQEPVPAGLPTAILCQDLQLTDGRLTFSSTETVTPLTATGITLSAGGDFRSLQGDLNLQAKIKALVKPTGDPGLPLTLDLSVKGHLANPDAKIFLTIDSSRIAGRSLEHANLSIGLHDRRATLDAAVTGPAGGQLTLTGGVGLERAFPAGLLVPPTDINAIAYTFTLAQKIPNLKPWLHPLINLSGKMVGRLTLTGNGATLPGLAAKVTLSASGQDLLAPGMGRPVNAEVALAAQMAPGKLTISRLTAIADGIRLAGSGGFQLAGRKLSGNLGITAGDLSRALAVVGLPSLMGAGKGALTVGGSLDRPQFTLNLTAENLKIDTYALGNLNLAANLGPDGRLNLERLTLQNQRSRIQGRGKLFLLAPGSGGLADDPRLDFSLQADHFDPGDFISGLRGDFTFKGALTGSLANPLGRISLSGGHVDLAGQAMETLLLDAHLEGQRLWLDRLLASVAPGEGIRAGGWIGLDQRLDLHLETDRLATAHIMGLRDVFPGQTKLMLRANAQGHLDSPDVQGQLTFSNLIVNDTPIADARLSFALHNMQATVAGNLTFPLEAAWDLKTDDFNLRLDFDNTETAPYFRAAGLPDLHGTLTGQVRASGNFRNIPGMAAQMALDPTRLLLRDTVLIQSERIDMHLADGKLSIPGFGLTVLSAGHLRVEGGADMGGSLDLAVSGRIPLAAAAVFREELADTAGHLAIEGHLSGSAADPRIEARIDLEKIAMAVPGLSQKLHDLNGRINLTAGTISFVDVNGFLDTGTFRLAGRVDYQAFTPTRVDLDLSARSLPLEIPDTLTLLLNGDIQVTGQDRVADARGALVVLEGVYYKDVKINLLQMTTTRERTVAPASKPVSVPYFDTVNLDIGISHRQAFMVQNNLAELEVSPDLKIGGTLARPIISGRAQVTTGTVFFQKKVFSVKKGVVDFVNPYKTEAKIDIQSETRIRTWIITLAISGTPDNLALQLSSDPREANSDILALILFGKTASELTAGGGTSQRSTGQILAEMIADTFGEKIKKGTGVDIFQLEANGNGTQEEPGVKVTVGKHLSDRMTLKYAVETKDGQIVQRAISEYQLLENLLVSGFQDNQGIYGSELVFRIEFR